MHASLADDWVGVSLFMQTLELELRLTKGFPDRGTPTLWAQGQTKYDLGPAMPGAVVTLSILEVGPVLELIWPSRLRHAPPPWIEVPARYLNSHASYGAGEGSRISKGFQDTCCHVNRHRSLPWLRFLRYPRHVRRWSYRSGEERTLANGIRCSQNGSRNRQCILRSATSTEGGRRCHVHLDKKL